MAEGTRGILTEADAELLTGEIDNLGERAEEQRQIRMRTRVRKAIAEFEFLFKHLSAEDRQHIFSPPPTSEVTPSQVQTGVGSMIALGYLGLRQVGSEEAAEQNLEEYVNRAKRKLELENRSEKVDELMERHKSGEQLSQEEVTELLLAAQMGYIVPGELAELLPDPEQAIED